MITATLATLLFLAAVGCGGRSGEATPIPTLEPTRSPTPLPTETPTPTATATPVPTPTALAAELPATPTAEAPRPTASPQAPGPDPDLVLARSAEAMARVESLEFAVTGHLLVDSANGTVKIPLTYEGVSVSPDRSQGSLVINVYFFSLQMELITVGGSVWTSNPQTEVWTFAEPGSIALPNPALLISGGTPALTDPETIGLERLDATETVHLVGAAQLEALSGLGDGRVPADVWIGVHDSLVYRIGAQGPIDLDELGLPLAQAGLTGEAELVLDIRLSNFNTPTTIEPPDAGQ